MEYIEIDANTLTEIDAAARKYEQPENVLSLVKEIKKHGVDVANEWSAKDLVNCLRTADQAYYHDGDGLTPAVRKNYIEIITDSVYDRLTDILRERFPKNKYLSKVGAEVPAKQTTHASQRMCKLPFQMASLDKLKPDNADKWLDKLAEVIVSNKVDGISIGIVSDGKGNIQCYSRGDANTGQNISHLVDYVPCLKKLRKTKKKFIIRGEFIITQSAFKKINDSLGEGQKKYANSRNLAAGLINRGSVNPIVKNAQVIAYSVIEPKLKPKEAVKFLKSLGLETPDFKVVKDPTAEKMSKLLAERKNRAGYDLDGLVITSSDKYEAPTASNPKNSKAFKDPSLLDTAQVVVLDIEWNVGKTGAITPTLILEPSELNGVIVKRATAHNAKYIYENKIGKGAVIKIERAGEVIPKAIEVIKPAKKAEMPTDVPYKWKGAFIYLDKDAENQNLSAVDQHNIKRINFFYRSLGAENVSEATFAKLYENGYNTVFKVAKITPTKLLKIDGFQTISANKIADTVKQALENIPLYLAMYSSSCFDRTLGSKRLKAIVSQIPDYQKLKANVLKQKIASLEGFSDITAEAFVNGLQEFETFLSKLQQVAHVEMPKKRSGGSTNGKLKDQVIVFTGFRDKDWSKIIEDNGGKEASSVSSKTTILVTKEPNSTSLKAQKARDLGVKTMGRDEFGTYLKKLGLI